MKRLGALSSVFSGLLLILGHVCNLEAGNAGTVTGNTFVLSAHLLIVFSFFWLYFLLGKPGFIGGLGMLSGIIGTVLVTQIVFVEIAGSAGVSTSSIFAVHVLNFIQMLASLLFVLGMVLMGVAIIRQNRLPRSGGSLLIVGTLIFAVGSVAGPLESIVEVGGAAVTGVGLILPGWRYLTNKQF